MPRIFLVRLFLLPNKHSLSVQLPSHKDHTYRVLMSPWPPTTGCGYRNGVTTHFFGPLGFGTKYGAGSSEWPFPKVAKEMGPVLKKKKKKKSRWVEGGPYGLLTLCGEEFPGYLETVVRVSS